MTSLSEIGAEEVAARGTKRRVVVEDRGTLGRGCRVMPGDGNGVNDRPRLEVRGVQCMKPPVIATLLQSDLQG